MDERNLIRYHLQNSTWENLRPQISAYGLVDILKDLGPTITGIEIGLATGSSSYLLTSSCPNISKLYGIDPFMPYKDWNSDILEDQINSMFDIFKENITLIPNLEFIHKTSVDAANLFKDESVDFIFIDGDHSEQAVYNDLKMYVPKVKKGGIISGHDWFLESVRSAVITYATEHNVDYKSQLKYIANTAWYWIKD